MGKYKLSSQDSNEETTQIVNVHEGIVKERPNKNTGRN
jgi:hypothetical protein